MLTSKPNSWPYSVWTAYQEAAFEAIDRGETTMAAHDIGMAAAREDGEVVVEQKQAGDY